MDVFILRLFSREGDVPKVRISPDPCKDVWNPSQPYVVSFLEQRKRSVFGAILQFTARPCKPSSEASWNYAIQENDVLDDHDVLKASNDVASDLILKLSDELPAPGSYQLNVIWDMRGIEVDEIRNFAVLFGAVKKLCSWHAGHLHAYVHQKDTDSFQHFITFMDPHATVSKLKDGACIDFHLRDEILWCGSLDVLSEAISPHQIRGLTLIKEKRLLAPEIVVDVKEAEIGSSDKSFSEESWGHMWIEPRMQLLAYVDISTIPLFYFSGKRFILQYRSNTDFRQDSVTIQKMYDAVNSNKVGAFLCCLKYSMSRHNFDQIPEFHSDKWKEAVMKDPRKIDAPKFVFPYEIRTLHVLLSRMPVCATNLFDEDLKQFTVHILHRPEELDFRLPFEHCMTRTGNCEEQGPPIDLDDLPDLNPHGILHKEKNLDRQIAEVLRQWIGQSDSGLIPSAELQRLVNNTVQKLDSEQESMIFDVSSLPKLDLQMLHDGLNNPFCLLEWQKNVFANMDKMKNKEQSKLGSLKVVNPLQPSKLGPASLDMHFKPEDVLKYFDIDGEVSDGVPILKPSQKHFDSPEQMKLKNFDDAIHVSYHGIAFNIDEQAAEKFDRMCRRLVQRQVKFETCSIGSTEKVPSPATINVADSPMNFKGAVSTSGSNCRKRLQLKKVAEKLYKKRIRTQHSVKSDIPPSTMVLRSTPKKNQTDVSQNNTALAKSEKVSEASVDEDKRQKHRTYVQDNKRRLQSLVTRSLIDNGISKGSKEFQLFSRRLYNVCMAFLRDLKSSKDLDRIMMSTVSRNVRSVISFKAK